MLTLYTTPVIYLWFDRLAQAAPRRALPASGRPGNGDNWRRTTSIEHLGALHPPAGRHHAADRRRWRWPGAIAFRFLPVSPLPQVDFPTIQVSASLPGAESGDHGDLGGRAAGAPVRAHRRRHRDDLDQLPRVDEHRRCSST